MNECDCKTCDGRGFVRMTVMDVPRAVLRCPDCPATGHTPEALPHGLNDCMRCDLEEQDADGDLPNDVPLTSEGYIRQGGEE